MKSSIESSFGTPNLLHFLATLTLRLAFLDSDLLKEDIGAIKDCARIAGLWAFLATETLQLRC